MKSDYEICSVINPFHATGLFRYLLSGGIEWDQWHEMGKAGVSDRKK